MKQNANNLIQHASYVGIHINFKMTQGMQFHITIFAVDRPGQQFQEHRSYVVTYTDNSIKKVAGF